jgi:ParB family chromosome partitioning protein
LPVLSAEEVAEADEVLRVERLVTTGGEPLPEEEWPNVPGARVHVVKEWVYPEDEHADADADEASERDGEDYEPAEPYQQYVPVWVVTDLDASGLRRRGQTGAGGNGSTEDEGESEEQAEARREERRRVIANNKAWASAETVRREWLAGLLARKTAPKGAEALICGAVVTGQHFLYEAMEQNHPMLRTLLDDGADKSRWDSASEVASIASIASTPKAATMTTLAAVVTAWEATTGKHSWRNPTCWDARMLGALMEWGYEPSDGPTPTPNHRPPGTHRCGRRAQR